MRMRHLPLFVLGVVALFLVSSVAAQSIVSARAGAIHHIEGDVYMNDQRVELEFAEFPNLKANEVLRTELGRAEMLLTPGVIVRLAEDSSLRMVSSRLTDTRLEFVSGSALIEAMELLEDNAVNFSYKDTSISFDKAGLYRLDSDPPALRVYDGQARVRRGDEVIKVKKGRIVELGEFLVATKFDSKEGDPLYRWSARRSGYLAQANLSAARTIDRWGMPWSSAGWRWNQYFGMFTFVPSYGVYRSPFGYSYWSPSQIYMVYNPPRVYYDSSGGGSRGGGGYYSSSNGYMINGGRSASRSVGSGVSVSAPTASGGSSAPAASPRSTGTATPRAGGRGR